MYVVWDVPWEVRWSLPRSIYLVRTLSDSRAPDRLGLVVGKVCDSASIHPRCRSLACWLGKLAAAGELGTWLVEWDGRRLLGLTATLTTNRD